VNWNAIIAIVILVGAAVLLGLWLGSRGTAEAVMRRDAERVVEIARLHEIADKHSAKAVTLTAELETAYEAADQSRAAADAAKRKLDALRRSRVRMAPVTTLEGCRDRLGQCEETTAKLDLTIRGLDDTVFAQDAALKLCEKRDIERLGQIENCVKAGALERKRTESWQQQTKRGRVKTAFFGIGIGLIGGAAGYGVGRATN